MDISNMWLPITTVVIMLVFVVGTTYKVVSWKSIMDKDVEKLEERINNFHLNCNVKADAIDEIEDRLGRVEQENHKIEVELAEIKVTGKNVEAIVMQIQTHFLSEGLKA